MELDKGEQLFVKGVLFLSSFSLSLVYFPILHIGDNILLKCVAGDFSIRIVIGWILG